MRDLKKNPVTVKEAHDEIVESFGKYGWYPLNDYLELRNVILFGERKHGYVPNIDQMVDGKVIDEALKRLDNELIIALRRLVTKKGREVFALDILPLGPGFVCGWEHGVMRTGFNSLEDCLNFIKARKDAIMDKAIESKAFYITGDWDLVENVSDIVGGVAGTFKMPTSSHFGDGFEEFHGDVKSGKVVIDPQFKAACAEVAKRISNR